MAISISDKPWSSYKASDYSLEQWHNACLIHLHDGPPTSKNQCKLPVKTPSGTVNRNGVHAALAALHGARGGVDAPESAKTKAFQDISRLYKQLGEESPALKQDATSEEIDNFIEHFGIKGMKWGVRRNNNAVSVPRSSEGKKADLSLARAKEGGVRTLTNKQLSELNNRLQMERQYSSLTKKKNILVEGRKHIEGILAGAGTLAAVLTFSQSKNGQIIINAFSKRAAGKHFAK